MNAALDANCFIDSINHKVPTYKSMQKILKAYDEGLIALYISRHALSELEKKPDVAFDVAKRLPVLPHWPIGKWEDQISTWRELAGTWKDAKRNDNIQNELDSLAKSGNDIRDRGAYLDALLANMDAFITSDKQLVGSAPAERIMNRFGLRVITPEALANEIYST